MKKLLIASNILLLGIIGFQACNSNSGPGIIGPTPDSCLTKFCKPYFDRDLGGKIDNKMIEQMSKDYHNDGGKNFINNTCDVIHDPHNTARTGARPDALSVVFDIEKLKNLIYQMEEKACHYKCDTSTKLGIRYYFIKYPCDLGPSRNKGDGLDGLQADLSNKHSLVMVPVYKNKIKTKNEWYDYDLWSSKKGNCFPPIFIPGDDVVFKDGILPDAGDNHGGIGPPPDPGTFPTNNNQ